MWVPSISSSSPNNLPLKVLKKKILKILKKKRGETVRANQLIPSYKLKVKDLLTIATEPFTITSQK